MDGKNASPRTGAVRAVAATFGILAGLGGIRHGIGEILQGNVAPGGLVIESWTQGPIATNMGGEPAFTIIPNILVTGILAIVVSLAVIVWAAAFVQRKNGGVVLIFLSILMFLVGGGFGPPIIGLLAGVAGTGSNAPLPWWRSHLPAQGFFARLWPWVFGISVISGVVLIIGSVILVYLGVNNPDLFLNNFFLTVILLLLATLTGIAYDIQGTSLDENRTQ